MKATLPKGMRNLLPLEIKRRNYIFDTLKKVFELYSFTPLETPAMESLSTLQGKYGDEGDKLLFKVLNSGDFLKDVPTENLTSSTALPHIAEKGLRYDLTVPFARYVVMNRDKIAFPFKRYQIQPVWRADRPQKGRYREFYQCDIDVIGTESLLCEVELIEIIIKAFEAFCTRIEIKLNHRDLLFGIAKYIGAEALVIDMTVAIDKLDKIGKEGVTKELLSKEFTTESIKLLFDILEFKGSTLEKLAYIKELFVKEGITIKGVEELSFILETLEKLDKLDKLGLNEKIELDLSLARGLSYYTGTIFEVKSVDTAMGSICGGGRYDNLTALWGLEGTSGIGISFGADRIYDVLESENKFPASLNGSDGVLLLNVLPSDLTSELFSLASKLRAKGEAVMVYPDSTSKFKKQMEYANKVGFAKVLIYGEKEREAGKVIIKDMVTGEQQSVAITDL